MTLGIYLDFLEPPGALACLFQSKADSQEPAPDEKCLLTFFTDALNLTMTNLQIQLIEAGKVCHGPEPAEFYIEKWRKHARPVATVCFGNGLYLLGYTPAPDRHPLAAQAWSYIKTALDLVSDDAHAIFADPWSYEATLPLRLLAAHNKLPKLTHVGKAVRS